VFVDKTLSEATWILITYLSTFEYLHIVGVYLRIQMPLHPKRVLLLSIESFIDR
jgi:hypothetical protein